MGKKDEYKGYCSGRTAEKDGPELALERQVVMCRNKQYSPVMWPWQEGRVAGKHRGWLSSGVCGASLLTSVYSHPSQNLYHEFTFGKIFLVLLFSVNLFISGFSSSAHFRARIPAWLFNKFLLTWVWSKHWEGCRLGIQPDGGSSPPLLSQVLGFGAYPNLSWASVSFSEKWGGQMAYKEECV